ncbi:MAG: RNA methyltransferase [Lachnospiraceae bacterium]|nr:RNA methyltransferase [Lachnospiraceae bacterium]
MIESPNNKKIKDVRSLLDRSKIRQERDAFVTEGIKMFSETPREDIKEVYVSESFYAKNPDIKNYDPVIVREDIFKKMSDTKSPQGIIAVVKQKHYPIEEILSGGLVMVLEELQDPGNLGTIIRTGEAAGISGIIMDEKCVDIYSPKVVRATMGAIYRVPFYKTESIEKIIPEIKKKGFTVYAAHLNGSISAENLTFENNSAILIGNEGNGLKEETSKKADILLKIPMKGRVESLNAAVSAAILMYKYAMNF